MPSYLVERFVDAATEGAADVAVTARAVADRMTAAGSQIDCVSALLIAEDEMALCVFEAASREAVREAHERAGIRFQRITQVTTEETGDLT